MNLDIQRLQEWIGRTESVEDVITASPIKALGATLDIASVDELLSRPLRPCWHWVFFLPVQRQSLIGDDGHPKRGGFLPPVPLPRRMWAGSQLTFEAPLVLGQAVAKRSRVVDVQLKQGRSGPLVFVKVHHEIYCGEQRCVQEFQDIVYRGMMASGAPSSKVPTPIVQDQLYPWSREITPDPVLLFRYSALTFNGHRIHYDQPFATSVEGYPGLVVHGPLIATLLLDLLHRKLPGAELRSFAFKAVSPLFDVAPFRVLGRSLTDGNIELVAVTPEGAMAMQATAEIA